MSKAKAPDRVQFLKLSLENVKGFGDRAELDLSDGKGGPAKWVLMVGRNGVGKTTILQMLAHMRPVPAVPLPAKGLAAPKGKTAKKAEADEPSVTKAAISDQEDNDELYRMIRIGVSKPSSVVATFVDKERVEFETHVTFEAEGEKLKSFDAGETAHSLDSTGPLLIGYGAARHVGARNVAAVSERSTFASLFNESNDLYDAEVLLEGLDYAAGQQRQGPDARNLGAMKAAAASLLEDLPVEGIEIRGPTLPNRPQSKSGVHLKTSSGTIPLRDASMGYQTVFALAIDLAWRMIAAYPDSRHPLAESAIVLIDEIDLHLHPSWQRNLRQHLLRHFPGIQFIGTTHSPVMAQETLAAGGNIALVHSRDGHGLISNQPLPPSEWRFDQILTSELFGFGTSRGPRAEELLEERRSLLRKGNRSSKEQTRLKELNAFADCLPIGGTHQQVAYDELMEAVSGVARKHAGRK